jgi:hypothetical protein
MAEPGDDDELAEPLRYFGTAGEKKAVDTAGTFVAQLRALEALEEAYTKGRFASPGAMKEYQDETRVLLDQCHKSMRALVQLGVLESADLERVEAWARDPFDTGAGDFAFAHVWRMLRTNKPADALYDKGNKAKEAFDVSERFNYALNAAHLNLNSKDWNNAHEQMLRCVAALADELDFAAKLAIVARDWPHLATVRGWADRLARMAPVPPATFVALGEADLRALQLTLELAYEAFKTEVSRLSSS